MTKSTKRDYIQEFCDAVGIEYGAAQNIMDKAKADLGVTYGEYFKNKLYELTPTQQSVEARRIITRRNNRKERLKKISQATGLTNAEIRQKIREINDKNIIKMTIILYAKYEVYNYADEALDEFLNLFVRRNELREQLRKELNKIDNGELSYSDIESTMAEFYAIVEKMMPSSLFDDLVKRICISYPELISNPAESRRIAIDMEATRVLLPFSLSEYVAFHFAEKTLEEKRKFISDKERLEILNKLNDPAKFDILDNKHQSYELLNQYYGRNIILLESTGDLSKFKEFCTGKTTVVVKPPCDTLGRGIRPVDVSDSDSLDSIFESLLKEFSSVLVEDLIVSHQQIAALNPDSVNTVRLITYFDGKKSIVHDAFIKVGQQGSFVDNGGAGGILVSIDPATGTLNSNGCDEDGVIYESHPYTKTVFNGYPLPDWQQAMDLGLELADKIPGLKYIGWDLTYTADNKWIVVEGNAKTQFFGQQCAADTGVRDNFLELIGYK